MVFFLPETESDFFIYPVVIFLSTWLCAHPAGKSALGPWCRVTFFFMKGRAVLSHFSWKLVDPRKGCDFLQLDNQNFCCCSVAQLLFATPWTAARQASLSFTISWSLLKLMSIELVMPSNHLVLCRPLLLLPSIFSQPQNNCQSRICFLFHQPFKDKRI